MNNSIEDKEIKLNIEKLIDMGQLDDATELLNDYKEIFPKDDECYSIEAIILMIHNRVEEAEKILMKGINQGHFSYDVFYNLGYICECRGKISEAVAFYNLADIFCKDEEKHKLVIERKNKLGIDAKRYNVVLYGKYIDCKEIQEKFVEWNVVAIVSTDAENLSTTKIEQLSIYQYDFIFVVGDLDKVNVKNKFIMSNINKLIYFFNDFKQVVIEGMDYKILKLLNAHEVSGLITGLSYAEVGVDEEKLPGNFINLALSSQDMYYDYEVFKYVSTFTDVKNSLKNVVLNLSYYSFDYDMTQTIAKYRIHRYMDYFRDNHHNSDVIGIDIIKSFYKKAITFEAYRKMNIKKANTIMNVDDVNGQYEAKKHSQMNYSATRKENKLILDEYLKSLNQMGIKPIILICPTSTHYRKHFKSKNKKELFYNIINRMKLKYEFEVLDLFDSELFNEEDFWDYSHLNGQGADKVTSIISQILDGRN